jgi:hypothetical protein
MTTETETQTEDTEEETAGGSLLKQIRDNWNGEKISEVVQAKLLNDWRAASKAVTAAEKTIETAKEKEYAACRALAEAFGGASLEIDGQVHAFASRNGKIFFRQQKKQRVVKIG